MDFTTPKLQSVSTACLPTRSPLPASIHQPLAALQTGELDAHRLHAQLERSEALRNRLIRFANSGYFPSKRLATDEFEAVRRIGLRTLTGFAVVDALSSEFISEGLVWYGHRPCGLLTHSLAVAQTAQALSELFGQDEQSKGVAYVTGLFHDVGKVEVTSHLGMHLTGTVRADIADVPRESAELTRLERLAVGFSHEEASSEIAFHWGLSERVRRHIALSHDEEQTSISSQILRIADSMVTAIGVGYFEEIGDAERFGDRAPSFGAHMIDSPKLLEHCQRLALRESARAVMIVQASEPALEACA